MSLLSQSDLIDSIGENLSGRFGPLSNGGTGYIISSYQGQIGVMIKPSRTINDSVQFDQVMYQISFNDLGTWYYKKPHAAETVFEETLVKLNLPLNVRESQKIVKVANPKDFFLDCFSQDSKVASRAYEIQRRLRESYDTIDKALRGKKEFSYRRRERLAKKHNLQQGRLSSYIDQSNNGYEGQVSLDFFPSSATERDQIRKIRNDRWRKIRFDVIFETRKDPALIFAELKGFPSLANRELEKRAYQLFAYDAWLKLRGVDDGLPLLYVSPTLISHKEARMVQTVKDATGREIFPVFVSTPNGLNNDVRSRIGKAEWVRDNSTKKKIRPEVVSDYAEELRFLGDFLEKSSFDVDPSFIHVAPS